MLRKGFSLLVALALLLSVFAVPVSAEKASGGGVADAHRLVVVLRDHAVSESAVEAITQAGGEIETRVDEIGVVSVRTSDPTGFIKAMAKNKQVVSVGPDLMVPLNLPEVDVENVGTSPADPTDPAAYTWGVNRVTNNGAAWEIHEGTHDVVVGIIDTGLDFSHPDLVDNIVPGSKTFVPGTTDAWDNHSHGTHVAGIIAANGRIKGVAPGVGIRAYRVFDTGGAAQSWIAAAIVAAANDGVDVINMSLGGFRVMGQWWYIDPETGERIRLGNDAASYVAWIRAIKYAINRNVTVVAAAGNDGIDLSSKNAVTRWYNSYLHALGYTMYEVQGATFETPGGIPGVVMVSAMGGGWDTPDRVAFYSNYGNGAIDLSGPGGDLGPNYPQSLDSDYWKYLILSTVPTYQPCNLSRLLFGECGYGWKAGTSMATPHVAGVAALIISEEYARTGSKPSPAQVVAKLKQTAEDLGKVGHDELYGHGMANAYYALGGE